MEPKKPITYGDVLAKRATFKKYVDDCYQRNKDGLCARQGIGFELCDGCPKTLMRRGIDWGVAHIE